MFKKVLIAEDIDTINLGLIDEPEPEPVPVTPLPPKRLSPTHRATPSRTNPDEVMLEGIDDLNSLTAELREAFEEHGARLRVQWWVE